MLKEDMEGGLSEIEVLVNSLGLKHQELILPRNPLQIINDILLGRLRGKQCYLLIDSAYYFESINYQGLISKWLYKVLKSLGVYASNGIIFSYEGASFITGKSSIVLRTFSSKTVFFLRSQHAVVQHRMRKYDFGYCGRFEREKGVLEFLEFVRNNPQQSFVICGAGSLSNVVEEVADNISNLDVTRFTDEIGAQQFYNSVRNLMILSYQEGCSLVSKEALALGCNIISSRVVGNGPLELALRYSKGYYIDEVGLNEVLNEDIEYIERYRQDLDVENFKYKLMDFMKIAR